jgi:hypothetical protein
MPFRSIVARIHRNRSIVAGIHRNRAAAGRALGLNPTGVENAPASRVLTAIPQRVLGGVIRLFVVVAQVVLGVGWPGGIAPPDSLRTA